MRTAKFALPYFAAALLFTAGCTDRGAEVAALQEQVSTLQKDIKALQSELTGLRSFVHAARHLDGLEKIAFLTPGAEGYTVVTSDVGKLTVSIANVVPYANGSKVTLQIGNLTAATIDGLRAKIEWGPMDPTGAPDASATRSRDIALREKLVSGSWTNSDVILERIAPSELGFIRLVDVGHRGVVLRR